MTGDSDMETPVVTISCNKIDQSLVKSDKEAIIEEEIAEGLLEDEKKDEGKEEVVKEEEKKKPEKPKKWEEDVVYLTQVSRTPTIPCISAHQLLVESWLKIQGIGYKCVEYTSHHPPKVELNGEELGENTVLDTIRKKFSTSLPAALTAEEKNIQHATISMVDNHLALAINQWRAASLDHLLKGYKVDLQKFLNSKAPVSLLNLYFKAIVCSKKGLKTGRHQEVGLEEGKEDLKVLSGMLGEKDYFFGAEPSDLDLVVFSTLSLVSVVDPAVECPIRDYLSAECENLLGLLQRVKERCWGDDWEKATGSNMMLNPHIPEPEPVVEEEPKEEAKEEEEKVEEAEGAEKPAEEKETEKPADKKFSMNFSFPSFRKKKEEKPKETVDEKDAEEKEETEKETVEEKKDEENTVEEEKVEKEEKEDDAAPAATGKKVSHSFSFSFPFKSKKKEDKKKTEEETTEKEATEEKEPAEEKEEDKEAEAEPLLEEKEKPAEKTKTSSPFKLSFSFRSKKKEEEKEVTGEEKKEETKEETIAEEKEVKEEKTEEVVEKKEKKKSSFSFNFKSKKDKEKTVEKKTEEKAEEEKKEEAEEKTEEKNEEKTEEKKEDVAAVVEEEKKETIEEKKDDSTEKTD